MFQLETSWANIRDRHRCISTARRLSMLGKPALKMLRRWAEVCGGPVIELGPYTGGSTIALVSGTKSRVVTVEIGGSNPHHASRATTDIIGDLRRNLETAGVSDRVVVVEGHFRNVAVVSRVESALEGERAGFLFVDMPTRTGLALSLYARYLRDDALVAVDDYRSEIERDKAEWVRRFVDRAVAEGALEEIGVFGWGTWFGRLTSGGRQRLMALRGIVPCEHETGHAGRVYAGREDLADDKTANASPLVLLEDGREIGPAHSLHADVREQGSGRYSHWSGNLWFSTSDNTDPRSNGRRYSVRVNGREIDLSEPEPLPG